MGAQLEWWQWQGPYSRFEQVANQILAEHINAKGKVPRAAYAEAQQVVETLYAQHKGEPAWDEAYRRWHEWDGAEEDYIED